MQHLSTLDSIRARMRAMTIAPEAGVLPELIAAIPLDAERRRRISSQAAEFVQSVRQSSEPKLMESFLAQYGLSTTEGVALMCLAEALLRVPDSETVDDLIADKIAPHDWSAHSGQSSSVFVNASTWALMLTGKVLDEGEGRIERTLRGMMRRLGEPVIRTAVGSAMREMGDQFVLGRNIAEALKRGNALAQKGYQYSYDMLGEAARTEADATRYFHAYRNAIEALRQAGANHDIRTNPGISVKLSALHPRYEQSQRDFMLPQLAERLLALCVAAKAANMGLNVDAEEADRLDLSLDVIEAVLSRPELSDWDGFGVVVQAYGQRAPAVIDWLYELATSLDRRIMVRLVKGAYWDTEIKRAQILGLDGFPVYTRKCNTDVAYLACACQLIAMTDRIYPQFATHNAHTMAAILEVATGKKRFEFQRLHGMGEVLHELVRAGEGTRCRIYAPVGAHEDLLAYLVRRLLENGANSSFVHQIVDEDVPAEEIARDPISVAETMQPVHNPAIAAPAAIYGVGRINAKGWDLSDPQVLAGIEAERAEFAAPHRWRATPLLHDGAEWPGGQLIRNPARTDEIVGEVVAAGEQEVREAVTRAVAAQPAWAALDVAERSYRLRATADLYERHAVEFLALATREAGKTLADGVAELREAVDFLRYYAAEAGEAEKSGDARGVIACISPWNFPLAIFTGQIAAALVTGNAVIAKPAEQTPLIAFRAVELMRRAGIPEDVIQLLPGDGEEIGGTLTADPRIAGVCFTGSTETARRIERQLAHTAVPDAMLIAETGGINAMIVDSTALPEQAVRDILASAFQSAGQRCSALRVLYVQKDVEDRILTMLKGAMHTLRLGDPWQISTDVGPVIDEEALSEIAAYCVAAADAGHVLDRLDVPKEGRFVAPHLIKVGSIRDVVREVFGPVLHVATFAAHEIDRVIDDINACGYGLTFGLHTRIDARVQHVVDRIHCGNIYVNRNQIGAVVGAQPFGGEGLSGTGPKAGGPHYLARFRRPRSVATDMMVAAAAPSTLRVELPKRFLDARQWADRQDRIALLRQKLRGKAARAVAAASSLEFGPVDLPGPTGEGNMLRLYPRGKALCLGPDADSLLAQCVQALAAGNSVIAAAPGGLAALKPLLGGEIPLLAVDGEANVEALAALRPDVVAFCGDSERARAIRMALDETGEDGPIVRLVSAAIDPAAYTVERAVCVDLTAAGGNATLLAAAG